MKLSIKSLGIISLFVFALNQQAGFAVIESYSSGAIQNEMQKEFVEKEIKEDFLDRPINPEAVKKKKSFEEIQKETPEDKTYNPVFKLNKINFEGNTVYKKKELDAFVKPIIGTNVQIKEIMNIAEIITRKYNYDGYVTSYAYIPEQDVVDGNITIRIVESKVGNINIENNKWTRKPYYKYDIFTPNGLKKNKIFKLSTLDSSMSDITLKDYLKASASIKRDKETQMTDINLTVKDRFPVKFNVAWDDHGRYYTGEQRARLTLSNENLTGFGDKIYGGTILSQNSTGVLAGYQIPVSPIGTKLAFDFGYTDVTMGHDLSILNLKGKSTSYMLRLIQPIYKTPSTEIEGSLGIDFSNTKSDMLSRTITDYSLRVFRAALYGSHDDRYGRTFAALNGDFGINGLGSSQNNAIGAPDTAFQKYSANLIRLQKIPLKESYLVFRIGGQYAPSPLYPSEQMQLGGYNSVRGYENGALLGDYGVNGSLELRTPIPGLKKILPDKYKSISDAIKFVTFYDFGYFGAHRNPYNYNNNFIHSVGAGLNIFFKNGIALNLAVGIPLNAKKYQSGSARFHFALSTDVDRLIFKKFEKESL